MPGRRPLVALVAFCVFSFTGCLHSGAQTAPAPTPEDSKDQAKPTAKTDPPPQRSEFALLPRFPPGTLLLIKPANPAPNPVQVGIATPKPDATPFGVVPVGGGGGAIVPIAPPPNPALDPPLLAAVRAYIENHPDRAIDYLRALDKPNQDFVLSLLPVLASGASADLSNDPATIATLVDQLHAVAGRLEPRAALRIEKVAFCNDVRGFGRFVPRPADAPYHPNEQVQFYLEVRNLTSEPTPDGYLARVQAIAEVRDAHQKLVEQGDPGDYQRRVPVVRCEKQWPSRSPLHEFNILYVFSAPAAPGVYTITIELHDPAGRRAVKTVPLEFCVAGP
jgi:hypothetical protein